MGHAEPAEVGVGRTSLIEKLSSKLKLECVDAAAAACLWLTDVERLEPMIRKSDGDKSAFTIH